MKLLPLACAIAAVLLLTAIAAGKPGELDSTFGGDGVVVADFGAADWLRDIAVQADGKIVAVGSTQDLAGPHAEFAVARFNADGSPDDTFGTGGKVTTSFGTSASANAVAVQGDGKIIVAGAASPEGQLDGDFALARYDADGDLDETFGTGGKVLTDFGSTQDGGASLAIQPDGKLVVAGTTRSVGPLPQNPRDFAVARYEAGGTLDETFGGDGAVATDVAVGSDDFAHAAALAPDGKIVVAGYRFNRADFTGNLELVRYEPDGDLDTTFGAGGKVLDDSGESTGAYDVIIQPDHTVVAAGAVEPDFAVFRYTPGGELDPTFGTAGVATTDFGHPISTAYALTRQPDGKIVAAGAASPDAVPELESPFAFAVARFDAEGRLDSTFHGGTVLTAIGLDTYDEASATRLQPDGRILVGGVTASFASTGAPTDFALIRYLPSPGYTREGSDVEVLPTDAEGNTPVRVTFATVTAPGETTLATSSSGPTPPPSWLHGRPPVYYDLATTAVHTGPIDVCIDYDGIDFATDPQLYHYVGNHWQEVATYEPSPDLACGEVESLSPFALFAQDTTAPTNPPLSSPSHPTGIWVNDNTVDIVWSGASDTWSGVDGYSYVFGPTPLGVPDTVKDAEETATGATSQELVDGDGYFHLRAVDNAGNWSGTVHLGPFKIDRGLPTNPALRGVSHVVGRSSTDPTVEAAWSGAGDALSGVDGFSLQWSMNAPTSPDSMKDAEESAAGTTSTALALGRWYLSLRTRDNAGNWSAPTNIGPFIIVRAQPKPKKVVLCHKGKTIKVAKSQVRKHRKHGDKLGRCKKKRKKRP